MNKKKVPGWDNYFCTTDGRIFSHSRKKAIELKPRTSSKYGHQKVALYKNKKRKDLFVHKIILLAFVGLRPKGLQCCHLDGNPKNNSLYNLKYADAFENQSHRKIHKTIGGINGYSVKLKSENVEFMRKNCVKGLRGHKYNVRNMAKLFGINHGTLSRILSKEMWNL